MVFNNHLRRTVGLLFSSPLIIPSIILVAAIWCSSGTLTPYAATHPNVNVLKPCDYLANMDQEHFEATFRFLDGKPRSSWVGSVVLRRILYPIFAYPFMSVLGFFYGGLFANVVLHLMVLLVFVEFLRRNVPGNAALYGAWLFATYPGVCYWAGLPYSYACIVPSSLLAMILLWGLQNSPTTFRSAVYAFLIGILCTGYDLLPYFGVAGLLVLTIRRRLLQIPLILICLILPSILVAWVLTTWYGVPLLNENSGIYGTILRSYLARPSWTAWEPIISSFPVALMKTFLYSNFVFLPLLFACALVLSVFTKGLRLNTAEGSLVTAIFLVFLFLNLAPPYEGWNMRGPEMSRLQQPLFVVLLTFPLRLYANRALLPPKLRPLVILFIAATVLANASICFGPVLGFTEFPGHVYYHFYMHGGDASAFSRNIEQFGARPLGFCQS